jgi:hypothetical protein
VASSGMTFYLLYTRVALKMVASISDSLNSKIIFISDAARLPKPVQFSEGFHASPLRSPSGKSRVYVRMSKEHWWSDTGRGKPKHSQKKPVPGTLTAKHKIEHGIEL